MALLSEPSQVFKQGIKMKTKIVLSATLFAVVFAVVQPVLAGPKPHATRQQTEIRQPVDAAPIRGDLHLFLKAF